MKYDDMKTEEKKTRSVVPSKPVSINVEGGFIEGEFFGTQKREGDNGEYTLHIIVGKGVALDKATKKSIALPAARYGVFGVTRLDRLMREVSKGSTIRINYLGLEKNPSSENNPTGEGEHHSFDVVLLD